MKPLKFVIFLLVLIVGMATSVLLVWRHVHRRDLANCALPSGERFLVYYKYHSNSLMALSGVGGLRCEFRNTTGEKKTIALTEETDFDLIDDVSLKLQVVDGNSIYITCSKGKWILTTTADSIYVSTNTCLPSSSPQTLKGLSCGN